MMRRSEEKMVKRDGVIRQRKVRMRDLKYLFLAQIRGGTVRQSAVGGKERGTRGEGTFCSVRLTSLPSCDYFIQAPT